MVLVRSTVPVLTMVLVHSTVPVLTMVLVRSTVPVLTMIPVRLEETVPVPSKVVSLLLVTHPVGRVYHLYPHVGTLLDYPPPVDYPPPADDLPPVQDPPACHLLTTYHQLRIQLPTSF
nr:uncharacterized protein LOC128703508 [Cherax quadricarinatus]